jgi:crotonobetainyl-CoA:carnitine CoA-transferase CaiB-like acyl-CoA transferase
MSSGIADYGTQASSADRPVPLPVQALDHATGYLMAAAVLRALQARAETGKVLTARLSLARTAQLLAATRRTDTGAGFAAEQEGDIDGHVEQTGWGPARRVRFPLTIEGMTASWDHPASKLRSAKPEWRA